MHIIVHRAPHAYSSHPCVTKLNNGDWLVAFSASTQRNPHALHPPDDPNYLNLLTRSRDQGRTWEPPRVAPNYDWYGVETPGIVQLSTGAVLLNQWRFLWYPLEMAKELWLRGRECFVVDPVHHRWQRAQTEADWQNHPWPYARADDGAYIHHSLDNGQTWSRTVKVEIAPFQSAFSPKGAVELSNGDLVLALGSHDHDPFAASFVVRSTDGGVTWSKPMQAARVPGLVFSEPSIGVTETEKLLMMSREEVTGYIYQSQSLDGGFTWSPPQPLAFRGGPTHCLRLTDGRMLIVYGRRLEPYAIRAALSEDEGKTWGAEIVIRDYLSDSNQGFNLGYPSAIEYAPGQLFIAYYAEDPAGVVCIQGTYFSVS